MSIKGIVSARSDNDCNTLNGDIKKLIRNNKNIRARTKIQNRYNFSVPKKSFRTRKQLGGVRWTKKHSSSFDIKFTFGHS